MDPAFLGPLVPIAAIIAFAAVKIAKLKTAAPTSLPAEYTRPDSCADPGRTGDRRRVHQNGSPPTPAWDRWDDPDQARQPPFAGVLANSVGDYPETVGLRGRVQLTGPSTPPDFTFDDDVDHAFAQEQRDGVFPERRLEWLMRRAHE